MIEPTIGRIVYYYPGEFVLDDGPEPRPIERPFLDEIDTNVPVFHAAIISKINQDGTLNLSVFSASGLVHPTQLVPLVQPGEEIPKDKYGASKPHATWMPYQVKKATGSESGEKEAGTQEI